MKQLLLLLAIAATLSLSACLGEDEAPPAAQASAVQGAAPVAFSPPQDGLLSPDKAKLYSDASIALLLLTQQWMDRMDKATDPQERILILGGFDKARDQVCRKIGLAGIPEFNWISEDALKNPANRLTAEKAGIQFRLK